MEILVVPRHYQMHDTDGFYLIQLFVRYWTLDHRIIPDRISHFVIQQKNSSRDIALLISYGVMMICLSPFVHLNVLP